MPLGYGCPPSPTSPHPPVCDRPLLSLPVSCLQSRFSAVPPISLLGCTSLGSTSSQILLLGQMAEPRQGAAACCEPEFPPRLPHGVPSDLLWNLFLLAPFLGFHLMDSISPFHPPPTLARASHASPNSFLPILLFILSSVSRHPFSSTCPMFPSSIPNTALYTSLPFLTHFPLPKLFPPLSLS